MQNLYIRLQTDKFSKETWYHFLLAFLSPFYRKRIIEMLEWMKENSALGFFINDLHRHPIAYHFIKISPLFSKSYLVKNDAPFSVLRGFKKKNGKENLRRQA